MMLTLELRRIDATSGRCAIKLTYPVLISTIVSEVTSGLFAITWAHEPDESPIISVPWGGAKQTQRVGPDDTILIVLQPRAESPVIHPVTKNCTVGIHRNDTTAILHDV